MAITRAKASALGATIHIPPCSHHGTTSEKNPRPSHSAGIAATHRGTARPVGNSAISDRNASGAADCAMSRPEADPGTAVRQPDAACVAVPANSTSTTTRAAAYALVPAVARTRPAETTVATSTVACVVSTIAKTTSDRQPRASRAASVSSGGSIPEDHREWEHRVQDHPADAEHVHLRARDVFERADPGRHQECEVHSDHRYEVQR